MTDAMRVRVALAAHAVQHLRSPLASIAMFAQYEGEREEADKGTEEAAMLASEALRTLASLEHALRVLAGWET